MGTTTTNANQFMVIRISGTHYCIPTAQIQDVLVYQPLTKVPLASNEILGIFNLRGRIVTVCNSDKISYTEQSMLIVTQFEEHLYGFVIDQVEGIIDSLSNSIVEYKDKMIELLDTTKLLHKYSITN